jgi:hypothetical protein
MRQWLPQIVGYSIILAALIGIRLFPDSWWTQELLRGYGLRPTGKDGAYSRRDHFRAAGVAFLTSLILVFLAFGAALLSEHYPNMSAVNWVLSTYMFGLVLLAGVALLCSVLAIWSGLRWKPAERGTDTSAS